MSEEENLKSEGDELAKITVESRMAADQLRKIYQLVRVRPLLKTMPLEYVQVHVQRQMVRVRGHAGFKRVLELLGKYKTNRETLERVLMYALMLYDYHRNKPVLDLVEVAEPIIQAIIKRHSAQFNGMNIKLRGNLAVVTVRVRRFYGSRPALANEIQRALKEKRAFSDLNVKVWIESGQRR